jgi:uncharacterized protein YggU (UPF0235/DUF167 family)
MSRFRRSDVNGPVGAGRSAQFDVRLTPRGGADRIDGVGPNGELLARVAAAPVDGAANRALIRLIADQLGVAPSAVVLLSGERGRRKRVSVDGVAPETIAGRWPGLKAR